MVADPGVHFILLRADRDLLRLAELLDREDAVAEISSWIKHGERGSDYLWDEQVGAFCARNVKTGASAAAVSNASLLAFYADAGSAAQREALLGHVQRICERARYAMPSWDPDNALFEPQRYWRGPIWPQMNYMIAQGFTDRGYPELAAKLRADLAGLIERTGFYEYFNPLTGDGCGGDDFSWTAAVWLAWLSPSASAT